MKLIAVVLLLFAVVGLSGCAGTPELPRCEGPWSPINPPAEPADET